MKDAVKARKTCRVISWLSLIAAVIVIYSGLLLKDDVPTSAVVVGSVLCAVCVFSFRIGVAIEEQYLNKKK